MSLFVHAKKHHSKAIFFKCALPGARQPRCHGLREDFMENYRGYILPLIWARTTERKLTSLF